LPQAIIPAAGNNVEACGNIINSPSLKPGSSAPKEIPGVQSDKTHVDVFRGLATIDGIECTLPAVDQVANSKFWNLHLKQHVSHGNFTQQNCIHGLKDYFQFSLVITCLQY
jgi:hypothetical protein